MSKEILPSSNRGLAETEKHLLWHPLEHLAARAKWLAGSIVELWNEIPVQLKPIPEAEDNHKRLYVISTRAAEPGKPISGGMAKAILDVAKILETQTEDPHRIIWYGYGDQNKDEHWAQKGSLIKSFVRAADKIMPQYVPILAHKLDYFDIRKVLADEEAWKKHYIEFCNRWIWPASHGLSQYAKDVMPDDIEGNVHTNKTIAMRVKKDLNGDKSSALWIHDYQHVGLALELRNLGVQNPIVYFHHIPIPPRSELDKLGAKQAQEFIKMMAKLKACDAMYFQTEQDVKNYHELIGEPVPQAAKAYETLHLPSDMNGRIHRQVRIGTAPISIDTEHEMELAQQPLSSAKAHALKDKMTAPFVFINFERCDYSKGILERLEAFENLLEKRPDLIGKIQVVLSAEPTRTDISDYKDYAQRVKNLADNLNEKYSNEDQSAIIFNNDHMPHEDLLRLMRNDIDGNQHVIAAITPRKDGMNLTAKEAVASMDLIKASPLLMSNGTGAWQELELGGNGVIWYDSLDPNHDIVIESMACAMEECIDLCQNSQVEINRRAEVMQNHVKEYNIAKWGSHFIQTIHQIQEELTQSNRGTGPRIDTREPRMV